MRKGVLMYTEENAIELMKKYATDDESYEKVMLHTMAVQKKAIEIAEKVNEKTKTISSKDTNNKKELIDIEFIKTAVILHDIGRFKCPPWSKDSIRHGIEGAKILEEEEWPKRFQKVCERHIGVGILKKDIEEQGLPLPAKDFVPKTKEEKIISYADNLAFHDQIHNEKDVLERYEKDLGIEFRKRVEKFHEEIHKMLVESDK